MEFEVLGRDQCLVGVAAPDVDVETYLGNKRGGYGFFAAEGTLKVDGDWKGGHGLAKFKRGGRVGVHVDMSRRTLHFSISRWVPKPDASAGAGASDAAAAGSSSSQNGAGAWRCTVLERVVEGLPSLLHLRYVHILALLFLPALLIFPLLLFLLMHAFTPLQLQLGQGLARSFELRAAASSQFQ